MGVCVAVHEAPPEPCPRMLLAALWRGDTHENISGLVHSSPWSEPHQQRPYHSESCNKIHGSPRIKGLPFQCRDMGL